MACRWWLLGTELSRKQPALQENVFTWPPMKGHHFPSASFLALFSPFHNAY